MQGPSNTDPNANNTPLTASGGAATTPGQTLATGASPLVTNGVDPRAAYNATLTNLPVMPNIPGWSGPGLPAWWDTAMQPADITAYNQNWNGVDQNALNYASAHAPQGLGGTPGAVPASTGPVTSVGGNVWTPGANGGYVSAPYNSNWDPSQGGSPYGPSTGLDANGNYDFSNLPPNYGANQIEMTRALANGESVDSAVKRLWGWTPDMGAPAPPGSSPAMMASTGLEAPGYTYSTTPWKGTTPYVPSAVTYPAGYSYGSNAATPAGTPSTTNTSGDQTGDPARWNALLSSGAYAAMDPAAQTAMRAVLGI